MLIDRAEVWLFATNTWVLAPEPGGPAVVIDPAPDAQAVLDLLARHDLTPAAALITHGHVDHVGATAVLADLGADIYLHPADEFFTDDPGHLIGVLLGSIPPGDYDQPDAYEPLEHGQRLTLAGIDIEVIHTPGHTPGHCVFYVPAAETVFTGDHLFAGTIGRTDLLGGDFDTLMHSMATLVGALPPETAVFPGHGATTTLASELATNPFLEALRL